MSRPSSGEAAGAAGGERETARATLPPVPETWTVLRMMEWSGAYLAGKGVRRGRLDAEHLLADLLDCGRLELYLQYDRPLAADELSAFRGRLLRRGAREPLQYILGHTPFRDLDLATDPRVLIPRPETEELVEAVLAWARRRGEARTLHALDIGTGSGAIALALATEGPFGSVVATDASAAALEVARANVERVAPAAPVELRHGAGWTPVEGERFDVVVSNPPYVAEGEREMLEPEVAEWEPLEALLAGPDGLDVIAEIVGGAGGHLRDGGLLALECGEGQARRVAELVRGTGELEEPRVVQDMAGKERIVLAVRRPRGGDGRGAGGIAAEQGGR